MSVCYRTLADLASGFQQWFTVRFTITGIHYQSVVLALWWFSFFYYSISLDSSAIRWLAPYLMITNRFMWCIFALIRFLLLENVTAQFSRVRVIMTAVDVRANPLPSVTVILPCVFPHQSRSKIVLYPSLIDSACWATARIPRWKRCTRTRYLIWHSRIIDDSSVAGALSVEKRASMESAVILGTLGAVTPSRLIYFLILSLHCMKSVILHLYTKWSGPACKAGGLTIRR